MPDVVGLLLAAGAGRRMGLPKALVVDDDGEPWVRNAVHTLGAGGCVPVIVVIGAEAARVRDLLSVVHDVQIVEATEWAEGMGASLRAGLDACVTMSPGADAALVHLVDVPDVGAEVVRRVGGHAAAGTLARAVYSGRPGHPVLLGREHWAQVVASSRGDQGARAYLAARDVELVDCSDLATGADVDSR
ncbi:MAG: nucleotidyltransferase family protein [Nocardioidaceae bacterium]